MTKRQCQQYHKEHHRLKEVADLADAATTVKTRAEADAFFKDRHGVPIKTFKVVREKIRSIGDRADFNIHVYFLAQHQIVKVVFLGLLPHLSELQQRVLVAFVHENYEAATQEALPINDKYRRFCEAVGDDPTSRTVEQEQEKQLLAEEHREYFTGSYIYDDSGKQVME